MIYICQQRQEWYRDYARSIGEEPLEYVGSASLNNQAVETAARIRDALNFDIEERRQAPSWTEALRLFIEQADDTGVLVMCSGVVLNNNYRKLDPSEFRGFAIADEYAPLVFINGADTKAGQMFTLAHELAHIWLGQSSLDDAQPSRVAGSDQERWCNQVAAELLVPLALLREEFRPQAELQAEVNRLARRFKVSTLVVLRRVYDADALSYEQLLAAYQEELERILAIPGSSGGNFYLTQGARLSKRFARALIASTLEGQTLHRDAFRMLGFSKLATFQELGRSLGVTA
jgi:Zn-dependent peptidase ImmA (M78 family)